MSLYQGNETLVTKTTVTVPINGGPVEAVSTIETVPYWTRSRRKTGMFGFFFYYCDVLGVIIRMKKEESLQSGFFFSFFFEEY